MQAIAQHDVLGAPEAAQRRQVVGRDCGERRAQVLPRPAKPAAVLLKQQHLVMVEAILRHGRAHFIGHDAEVLANDEALVALALERHDREQQVQRIMHVGPVDCGHALRHPPQAK